MSNAVDRLLATAKAEVGYLEKASNSQLDDKTANAGRKNWTKYARDLDKLKTYNGSKNGYAWCDVFADWCYITTFGAETGMAMIGQAKGSSGASCTSSVAYYKRMNRFYLYNPQPGDQIFFKNAKGPCHTGIVTKVANGRVYTIEGNTSSAAGVVPNGGAVREKSYLLNDKSIAGYGRPRWELVEQAATPTAPVQKTVNYQGKVTASVLRCRKSWTTSAPIVTSYRKGTIVTITKECENWGYTGEGWVSLEYISKIAPAAPTPVQNTKQEEEDMTQEQFNKMMDEYIKQQSQKPASAYQKEGLAWGQQNGLMVGDGTGNTMPQRFLTRGEFITVLKRFFEKCVK